MTSQTSKSFSSWPAVYRWRWRNADLMWQCVADMNRHLFRRHSSLQQPAASGLIGVFGYSPFPVMSLKMCQIAFYLSWFVMSLKLCRIAMTCKLTMRWWANLIKVLLILPSLMRGGRDGFSTLIFPWCRLHLFAAGSTSERFILCFHRLSCIVLRDDFPNIKVLFIPTCRLSVAMTECRSDVAMCGRHEYIDIYSEDTVDRKLAAACSLGSFILVYWSAAVVHC